MSESKNARIGLIALAIAVVAGVGALVWVSQSDDDDAAEGPEAEGEQIDKDRERGTAPTLAQGGDGASSPPAGDGGAGAGGSLAERLGGRKGIHAITDRLLQAVPGSPVLMANEKIATAARKVNVRKLHERFTNWVCREAGGPCRYRGRPMKDYFEPLGLTAAEWAEVDKVFAATLDELEVSEQDAQQLRALLRELKNDSE